MRTINTPKRNKTPKKLVLAMILLILILLVVGGLIFRSKNTTTASIKGVSASETTKGETAPKSTASSSQKTSGSEPGDQKSDSGGSSSTATLLDPTGNFVSNHRPGDNGSPMSETSVCTTSPGASCKITFTKDGIVKSLPSQTTDRGGSTYWNNWQLSDIGVTQGSWSIQAIATLNGQTKTVSDATLLVVQ